MSSTSTSTSTEGSTPSATAAPAKSAAAETTELARKGGQRHGQDRYGQRFTADVGYVDVDTRVSRESYGAARMAAGAVILAVSHIISELCI